eukprot:gene9194-22355_t
MSSEAACMVGCSPGGQVATGGYDGAVRLLDRHTGNLAAEIYQYSGDTKSWLHTTSFTVSPGRKQYLAAGSRDALVSVHCQSVVRNRMEVDSDVGGKPECYEWCVAYSEQGGLLASPGGPVGLCTRLWQADTGASLRTLPDHASLIMCTAFNTEGTMLVTGAADCSIRFWQVPSGQALRALAAHASILMCLAFSSDSRFLASGSANNTIMVWNLFED